MVAGRFRVIFLPRLESRLLFAYVNIHLEVAERRLTEETQNYDVQRLDYLSLSILPVSCSVQFSSLGN